MYRQIHLGNICTHWIVIIQNFVRFFIVMYFQNNVCRYKNYCKRSVLITMFSTFFSIQFHKYKTVVFSPIIFGKWSPDPQSCRPVEPLQFPADYGEMKCRWCCFRVVSWPISRVQFLFQTNSTDGYGWIR